MLIVHPSVRPLRAVFLLSGVILTLVLVGLAPHAVFAGPVLPEAISLTQPDGSSFTAIPYGDEWSNGYETAAGHTIIENASSGFWVLAERSADGQLTPGSIRADREPPAGAAPHLRATIGGAPPLHVPERLTAEPQSPQANGNHPTLVILVEFADRPSVGSTATQWKNSFFAATDSVKDYYDEVSFGNLVITPAGESHGTANDGIIGWLPLGYNHPDTRGTFGAANLKLARDAMIAADPYIDYAAYDTNGDGSLSTNELHIVVIAAGYETSYGGATGSCTPGLWGHQYALRYGGSYGVSAPVLDLTTVGYYGYTEFGEWHCSSNDNPGHMATIGIMVHEMGHDLNWPDLYDTDNSSYGVGQWSVMGYGSWLRTTGYSGSRPPHPDAFLKWYQGWLEPEQIVGAKSGISIAQAATNPRAIQLLANPGGVDWSFNSRSGAGEYFLVENRQKIGYDAGLPGCGLLVWHIDETRVSDNRTNATDTRRLVDLEEADGLGQIDTRLSFGDAGDPFPGSTGNRSFNSGTNPNSKLYSGVASGVALANVSTTCAPSMTADFTTLGGTPAAKKLHLPLLLKAPLVITGRVRFQNQGIGNISLQLRACSGDLSECTVVRSTKTDATGVYKFTSTPSLPAGKVYQVEFQNGLGGNADNDNHLTYWRSFGISSSAAGSTVAGGDFDISNVALLSPAHNASPSLPTLFTWSNRGVAGDTYSWAIADEGDDELCYMHPPLATTSFVMTTGAGEECGLWYETPYRWYVYVAAASGWSGGYGLGRFYRNVRFVQSAGLAAPLTSESTGQAGVRSGSGRSAPAAVEPE
jgi:M6 family metalloprotease-like protein